MRAVNKHKGAKRLISQGKWENIWKKEGNNYKIAVPILYNKSDKRFKIPYKGGYEDNITIVTKWKPAKTVIPCHSRRRHISAICWIPPMRSSFRYYTIYHGKNTWNLQCSIIMRCMNLTRSKPGSGKKEAMTGKACLEVRDTWVVGNTTSACLIHVEKFVPMHIQWSNPYEQKDRVSSWGDMTEWRGTNDLLGCMSLVLMKMGRGNPYDRGMTYILGESP